MNKYLVVILLTLGLTACQTKNEQYYLTHLQELQKAVKSCPSQQPQGMTCEQLQQIAKRMNELAFQLQLGPQGFGTNILNLQRTIVKQQLELKQNNNNTELKDSIAKNQHELAFLLAVVKWLESPES